MRIHSQYSLFKRSNIHIILAYEYSIADKAERLKQWLEANRNSFPQPITDDLISAISGNNEIASTIVKIFGSKSKDLEARFTRTTALPTSSRNGIKVADRQGQVESLILFTKL